MRYVNPRDPLNANEASRFCPNDLVSFGQQDWPARSTEAINHDPAVTFLQTGAQLAGRPSIGSWISYGLGSENQDLPAFVAMVSQGSGNPADQPLYDRLHCLGVDHEKLHYKVQGRNFRLTDVHGTVVKRVLG